MATQPLIEVREPADEFDRQQMGALRYREFVRDGNMKPLPEETLLDPRDERSTCLLAYLLPDRERPVGTLRVTIEGRSDFETEEHIRPHVVPGQKCAEVTRLAVDVVHRGRLGPGSVFLHLIRAARETCLAAGVRHILCVAWYKSVPVYERIGFERVEGPFRYAHYVFDHYVLRLDVHRMSPRLLAMMARLPAAAPPKLVRNA